MVKSITGWQRSLNAVVMFTLVLLAVFGLAGCTDKWAPSSEEQSKVTSELLLRGFHGPKYASSPNSVEDVYNVAFGRCRAQIFVSNDGYFYIQFDDKGKVRHIVRDVDKTKLTAEAGRVGIQPCVA